MRILFVADGRSPIAANWIRHFIEAGHDVHVLSTYPCDPAIFSNATVHQSPVAFAGLLRQQRASQNASKAASLKGRLTGLSKGRLARPALALRFWIGPLMLKRRVKRVRELALQIEPDLVHAMRIPFEAMLAAESLPGSTPFVVSIWGNDLTLFADRYPVIAARTRRVLKRADFLHCDCRRDLDLARNSWGYDKPERAIVLPGGGGLQSSVFHRGAPDPELMRHFRIPEGAPVIINPRGFRAYVRSDVFFAAIPAVLQEHSNAVFVCVGMSGNRLAERWVKQLGIEANVRLLPQVAHKEMGGLFRLCRITVSPSLHDGTPNTLLEAMACGCFPVAGDIESVREWIDPGVNGLLFDATSIESTAAAMIRALDDEPLRRAACDANTQLVAARADYDTVMQRAEAFYASIAPCK